MPFLVLLCPCARSDFDDTPSVRGAHDLGKETHIFQVLVQVARRPVWLEEVELIIVFYDITTGSHTACFILQYNDELVSRALIRNYSELETIAGRRSRNTEHCFLFRIITHRLRKA